MKWALISNNTVINIVEQPAQPSVPGDWVAAASAAIGWVRGVGGVLQPPTPQDSPYKWFIDPGSFRDRFGATKLLVLSSQDATIKALLADMAGRPWIDLQRADVAQGLAYIGTIIPEVTPQLRTDILTIPPTKFEQLILSRYFN